MSDPSGKRQRNGERVNAHDDAQQGRAGEARCRQTPSTCMDDLCRNSQVGLCGNEDYIDELSAIADTDWDLLDD